uniref:Uncharacterized protein n=1 Tax=Glossina austeni TaxID=7395 RepID=A0A1A9VDS2_GLOAU
MKIPQVDVERAQTNLMVENLDTQLKQMSEDLKEILEKVLNAHMSSLQWTEQGTTNISNKLKDITKMHETFKRDTERSFLQLITIRKIQGWIGDEHLSIHKRIEPYVKISLKKTLSIGGIDFLDVSKKQAALDKQANANVVNLKIIR